MGLLFKVQSLLKNLWHSVKVKVRTHCVFVVTKDYYFGNSILNVNTIISKHIRDQ